MKKMTLVLGLIYVAIAGVFNACNEPEPEQLIIQAEIPESVTLRDSYSVIDTFKFSIESAEAALDSVQLFEGNTMYIGLGVEDMGGDVRKIKLYFIYNPNSTGIKNFELRVKAGLYRKNYPFTVSVIN